MSKEKKLSAKKYLEQLEIIDMLLSGRLNDAPSVSLFEVERNQGGGSAARCLM